MSKDFALEARPPKLCIFQVERDGVVCSVATDGWVLIIENRVLCGVQSQESSDGGSAGHSTINEGVINHIVVGRILIDAPAERAEDALVHWEIPHLRRDVSFQIQAILAGTRVLALISWRHLKSTLLPVVKDQKILIILD